MALAFGFEDEMKKSFEELKKKISNNNTDGDTDVKESTVSEEKKWLLKTAKLTNRNNSNDSLFWLIFFSRMKKDDKWGC